MCFFHNKKKQSLCCPDILQRRVRLKNRYDSSHPTSAYSKLKTAAPYLITLPIENNTDHFKFIIYHSDRLIRKLTLSFNFIIDNKIVVGNFIKRTRFHLTRFTKFIQYFH